MPRGIPRTVGRAQAVNEVFELAQKLCDAVQEAERYGVLVAIEHTSGMPGCSRREHAIRARVTTVAGAQNLDI